MLKHNEAKWAVKEVLREKDIPYDLILFKNSVVHTKARYSNHNCTKRTSYVAIRKPDIMHDSWYARTWWATAVRRIMGALTSTPSAVVLANSRNVFWYTKKRVRPKKQFKIWIQTAENQSQSWNSRSNSGPATINLDRRAWVHGTISVIYFHYGKYCSLWSSS